MNFLYPSFLWALTAIAIPIIIHLFNFRRYKTVHFSNVSYLKNIKQETKSKSQFKHLLILLARIFAIIFLVLAFAQPYKPINNQQNTTEKTRVLIYIDNSFSMNAEGENGNLFSQAVNASHQILNAFPQNTDFALLTNDFEASQQHFNTRDKIFEQLTKLKVSSQVRNISAIYSRASDLLNPSTNKEKSNNYLFLISDFQKSTSDIDKISENEKINTYLIPISAELTNNLFIDSVYFDSPGRKINQAENINVRIVNKSDENYKNIPIKLTINNQQKALASFSVSENSSTEVKLSYTNPAEQVINAKVEISDYPITFDNDFYFSYMLSQKINILEIYEKQENKFIQALFSDNENINLKSTQGNKVSISELNSYNLIILNELVQINSGLSVAIRDFVFNGGTLLILPSLEAEKESYNTLLAELNQNQLMSLDTQSIEMNKISTENEIYKNSLKSIDKNVKYPKARKYFNLSKNNSTLSLISSKNKAEILTANFAKKGKSYLSALPFNSKSSDLVHHKLFIPTLYNIALFSQNISTIYYTIGKDNLIDISLPMNEDFSVLHIKNSSNDYDFIPELIKSNVSNNVQIDVHDNIKEADNYLITEKKETFSCASFNYDRAESTMDYFSQEDLLVLIKKANLKKANIFSANDKFISETLEEFTQGAKYWKYFLALALLFLAFEIILIRLKF